MAAVDIDRQAIERRDFPIARRGYEPAAVDAHLRALASEIEELQRERSSGGAEPSLASTAGTQVQSILAAAEAAAADIEQQASESASATRELAEQDAARTREDAVAKARAHVAAVSQATAVLLERVAAMDGEVGALLESVRAGAGRLAGELTTLDANIGELYDAAAGRTVTHAVASEAPAQPEVAAPPVPPSTPLPTASAPAASAAPANATAENGDVDGARLVALNMALNGESREDADRYLAENYELADRKGLIDEVYAAIDA
jgi:cell division septum initiation protein DivIVA